MNKKDILIIILAITTVALLFTTTIQYYNAQLSQKDAEKAALQNQISKVQKPDLVTSLGIEEKLSNYTYNQNDPTTYNHLLITGIVTNSQLRFVLFLIRLWLL
jgi:hypothetical protein